MVEPASCPDSPSTTQQPPLSRAVILAVLAASVAVAGFAISSQSYWIDEALSLIVAKASSPDEAWKYAQAVRGSTLQMPLYQLYLYGWHKTIGGGEWAMRVSNIPFFVVGQLAFLLLLRQRPKLALTACLLAMVSPLLWVYLDETRPYILQYAAACWLVAAIARLTLPGTPERNAEVPALWAIAAVAGAVLFGASLLGVVWTVCFLAALAYATRTAAGLADTTVAPARHRGRALAVCAASLLVVAGLTFYYVWTWETAGGGYHRSGVNLLSVPFVAYEFFGFSGFGPGKLQLRTAPLRSVLHSLPALIPLVLCLGLLGLLALRQLRSKRPDRHVVLTWLLALGLPTVIIFVSTFLADHRPLPRHFIPALPAVLLGLAGLLHLAMAQRHIVWRIAAVLVPLLWLASSLNLRWQPAHAKDDYRTASAIAAAALRDNMEVWWAADAAAAYIYLTPIALEKVPGRAWAMQAPSWEDIRFKFPPRVIFISKPDVFDPQGAVARYAAENRFSPVKQLQAFTIFMRAGDKLPSVEP